MIVYVAPKSFLSRTVSSENSESVVQMKSYVREREREREKSLGRSVSKQSWKKNENTSRRSNPPAPWKSNWSNCVYPEEEHALASIRSPLGEEQTKPFCFSRAEVASHWPTGCKERWLAFQMVCVQQFWYTAQRFRMQHCRAASCQTQAGTQFI